jgi:hypothetical protein
VAAAGLAAAGLLAFLVQLRRAWPFLADDAYITFRHAANWLAGCGPNFNCGGERAEGASSFGWLLVSLLPEALGFETSGFAKALGVLAALGTALLLGLLTRELQERDGGAPPGLIAPALAVFLWLGWHPVAIHAASGMETLAAAAAMTALARAAWRLSAAAPGAPPPPRSWSFGAAAFAAALLRPELALAALLLFAWLLARTASPARPGLLRATALSFFLPGALFFAARAIYYGHLFPLAFYAKIADGPALPGLASTLVYLQSAFGIAGLFGAVALLARPRLAILLLPAACTVTVALLTDPVMDFDFRYCTPATPLLFAVAGIGFARIVDLVTKTTSYRYAPALLSLAAVLFLAARQLDPAVAALRERHAYGLALRSMNVRLGQELADFKRRAGRTPTLAIGDAGAIPYFSGWRTLDTFGLNEPAISVGGRHDPAYVLDSKPDLVALVSLTPREFRQRSTNPQDLALYQEARTRGMRPAVILSFSAASFLWILAEPGSEIERFLQARYLPDRKPAVPGIE